MVSGAAWRRSGRLLTLLPITRRKPN
jgi:hypothetical protein